MQTPASKQPVQIVQGYQCDNSGWRLRIGQRRWQQFYTVEHAGDVRQQRSERIEQKSGPRCRYRETAAPGCAPCARFLRPEGRFHRTIVAAPKPVLQPSTHRHNWPWCRDLRRPENPDGRTACRSRLQRKKGTSSTVRRKPARSMASRATRSGCRRSSHGGHRVHG